MSILKRLFIGHKFNVYFYVVFNTYSVNLFLFSPLLTISHQRLQLKPIVERFCKRNYSLRLQRSLFIKFKIRGLGDHERHPPYYPLLTNSFSSSFHVTYIPRKTEDFSINISTVLKRCELTLSIGKSLL